jgi:hypothetical protein
MERFWFKPVTAEMLEINMADDLVRNLKNLSEEVLLQNMQSWDGVLAQIEKTIEKGASKYWTKERYEFIRDIADTMEARLFRAGLSKVYVTISTAEKKGLPRGEFFIRLIWNDKNIPKIDYGRFGKKTFQTYLLNDYDQADVLMMPHLKKLWYDNKRKNVGQVVE